MLLMRNGILQNNEGISPVLGFILMLAIGVTILSTVQLSFVPVWNTQEELNHLKLMQDDFKVLKSNIDSGILGGTTLSSPLIMGFKYSPKMLVYNPKDEAYASLEVRKDAWVEVRYNEVFPEGMTDDTSIKNVSTGMIIYALQGARNYNSFIYENGLIRRSGSNFTTSSQTVLANGTIYLPSVKALDYGSLSGVEKKTVNIYPTSQQKNSVIGRNVWIILYTKPDPGGYVDWWAKTLESEGAGIRKKDSTNGIVIANISSSMVIKMGEAYISSSSKAAPPHSPARRIVRVSGIGSELPVGGTTSIMVEVQDEYNNPVPNVPVSFSPNFSTVGHPSNSYSNATISPGSAVSGSDGRASVTLTANDAGFYYIDASLTDYKTTLVYSASSQGGVMKLVHTGVDPEYTVNATLTDSMGGSLNGKWVTFDTSDGIFTTLNPKDTVGDGTASIVLNVSDANGTKITNIQVKNTSAYTANITWDTINNITVTAKSGYVFNSRIIPTTISTTGCVMYGTSPGVYPDTSPCDTGSSHSASLTGLSADTAYYFIVNGSRPGKGSVSSTEYMFVTGTAIDDGVPPASISNLIANVTGLFINLTWNDPLDLDFDHVEIYIDGSLKATPSKGAESFNAYYFLPGTWHSIATRTVDSTGRMNATWVYGNATTTSLFTYVYGFYDTTGLTTSPDYAKNATDGLYAILAEEPVGGSNQSHRPTNPSITITNGTQQAGGTSVDVDVGGDLLVNITSMTMKYNTTHASANPAMTTGTISAGSYLNTLTSDNVRMTLREVNAAPFPYNSDWASWQTTNAGGYITSINISLESYSDSLTAEPVYIQTWNYTSGAYNASWVLLGSPAISAATENILAYNITDPTLIKDSVSPTGAFRIRLADDSTVAPPEPGVAARTRLYIDEFKVDFTYYNTLNVTYTFDETNSSSSWQSISIQDSSYSDPLTNVSIFNNASGLWESLFPTGFNGGTTLAQHVNKVVGASGNASDYDAGSGQIKIKYNWTGSTQNNTLGVDLLNVTVNYAVGGVYKLNITSNITGIPNTTNPTNHELQIKYYVSGDNFTLQVWNGASFINRTTLNKSSPDYFNYTLSSNELQFDGSTTGGTVDDIDQYYVLVRYVDLTSSGVQGNLYLDYQRVYSW